MTWVCPSERFEIFECYSLHVDDVRWNDLSPVGQQPGTIQPAMECKAREGVYSTPAASVRFCRGANSAVLDAPSSDVSSPPVGYHDGQARIVEPTYRVLLNLPHSSAMPMRLYLSPAATNLMAIFCLPAATLAGRIVSTPDVFRPPNRTTKRKIKGVELSELSVKVLRLNRVPLDLLTRGVQSRKPLLAHPVLWPLAEMLLGESGQSGGRQSSLPMPTPRSSWPAGVRSAMRPGRLGANTAVFLFFQG